MSDGAGTGPDPGTGEGSGGQPPASQPSAQQPYPPQQPPFPAPPVTPPTPPVVPPAQPVTPAGGAVSAGGFVLTTPQVPPTTSGLAAGGLASGIGACVLGLLGCCWWPTAVLPGLMGAAAVVLGYRGVKQVAASGGEMTGRGVAIAAMITGGVGMLVTLVALVIGLVFRLQQGPLFG